jgi:putative secretion ATPase (PEP-CTERM system associated)
MYESHFGFSGSPFRLAPDPKFFFGSKSHNKAMAYLHYGLRQAEGFIVITGEIGAGKSMLIGHLLDQLDRSNVLAANLLTPNLPAENLLSHILSAFRIEPASSGVAAEIEAFEDFLFDQMNHGRRVLLVVDEAQNLPLKTLEELRILSNLEYDGTPLFQVFLVGQPDFRETMARPDHEQLRQRVIASYHLEPMSREETRKYIEHRLRCVGWSGEPSFAPDAFDAIHAATGGVPRKIHKLCNRLLLHCAVERVGKADAATVAVVLADLSGEQQIPADRLDVGAASREAPAATAESPPTPEAAEAAEPPVESVEFGSAPIAAAVEEAISPPSTTSEQPMSVFDRLRARRAAASAPASAEPPSPEALGPPKPATLDDVANAIAAARAGRSEFDDALVEGRDLPAEVERSPDPAPPPAGEKAEGWKRGVVASLNETRDDLKRAHQSVARLRRQLTEIDRRRRKRRVQISASLERAESLLTDLQNAWR